MDRERSTELIETLYEAKPEKEPHGALQDVSLKL